VPRESADFSDFARILYGGYPICAQNYSQSPKYLGLSSCSKGFSYERDRDAEDGPGQRRGQILQISDLESRSGAESGASPAPGTAMRGRGIALNLRAIFLLDRKILSGENLPSTPQFLWIKEHSITSKQLLESVILTFLGGLALTGFLLGGLGESFVGFWTLQLHPSRLLNDFVEIAGIGPAYLNAALVGLMGYLSVKIARIELSGVTFAAILTMAGFGLFGKTPVNILPIILGVWLAAKSARKHLKDYLIIALFGTALGPLVSTLFWEMGLPLVLSLPLGILGGLVTGFFLPAVAVSMLHLHQGYNLYNMGLSCGFFGLFAASLLTVFGYDFTTQGRWNVGTDLGLVLLVPAISLLLVMAGWMQGTGKAWKDFWDIQKIPGRLPSDFTDLASLPGSLINAGLVGLVASAYLLLIGAPFNGPVLGGLLTIIGFGAFGTHLKNSWPVVLGVVVAALAVNFDLEDPSSMLAALSSPGPVLAFLFSTTLSPLAGQFGPLVGFIAGFIHLVMVSNTGSWHGGMNLYNNGFAGGLTATIIVAFIQWRKTAKEDF
jgi:hypothetical protein